MVQWCYENKSKLRKIRSTLELEIRVQEFIELVRTGRRTEAVRHARKYIADSGADENIAAVKKCMGLLAFPVNTSKPFFNYIFAMKKHFKTYCENQYILLFLQLCFRMWNFSVQTAGIS